MKLKQELEFMSYLIIHEENVFNAIRSTFQELGIDGSIDQHDRYKFDLEKIKSITKVNSDKLFHDLLNKCLSKGFLLLRNNEYYSIDHNKLKASIKESI